MPMGKHYRASGILLRARCGWVLEVDGGGTWPLDIDQIVDRWAGLRVRMEGHRSGFDRLDVEWISQADQLTSMGRERALAAPGDSSLVQHVTDDTAAVSGFQREMPDIKNAPERA